MLNMKRQRTTIGDVINVTVLLLMSFVCIYPFWYIFIGSISSPNVPVRTLTLLPKQVTLFNYKEIMNQAGILQATIVSVARTVLGTFTSLLFTSYMAYLCTLERMPARKFFYRMVIVTMYLNAGMIPVFLTYRAYGLLNNFWVYIIPGLLGTYNMILIKTYVENGIPASLRESAMLDGASELKIFSKIILPLSTPILATVALFSAVGQWNSWYDSKIYNMNAPQYDTLQYLLQKKLSEASEIATLSKQHGMMDLSEQMAMTPDSVRLTLTMIVAIPIFCVYPFLQRYFTEGIMIGAVKG